MEQAVIRGRAGHPALIGNNVLVGRTSTPTYVTGMKMRFG